MSTGTPIRTEKQFFLRELGLPIASFLRTDRETRTLTPMLAEDFKSSVSTVPPYLRTSVISLFFAKIYVTILLVKKVRLIYATDYYSKTSDFGEFF